MVSLVTVDLIFRMHVRGHVHTHTHIYWYYQRVQTFKVQILIFCTEITVFGPRCEAGHIPLSFLLNCKSLVPLLLSLVTGSLISQSLLPELIPDILELLTSQTDTISLHHVFSFLSSFVNTKHKEQTCDK